MKRLLVLAAMVAVVIGLMSLFTRDADRRAPQSASHAAPAASSSDARASRIAKMAADWKGPVNFTNGYAALDPLAARSPDEETDTSSIVKKDAGPGAELVSLYCAACHSLEIVQQQKQSQAGWRYLLAWMEAEQGMAPLAPEDERQIIAYLSKNFGPE